MARVIEFDTEGHLVIPQKSGKAVVRFPTEVEYNQGITEIPRSQRVKEGQQIGNKVRD